MVKFLYGLKWPLTITTAIAVFIQLYMVFLYAPPEKFMGNVQRLMYFHVPSAFNSFAAFGIVFAASILYLITKNKRWDQLAYSAAEVGVLFTTLMLVAGSFWARPVWNAWWVWDDPRLITSLILWFLYIAYLLIQSSVQGEMSRRKFAAIFGIIAFIDVPLVYFSIKWWRTIHPKVITEQGVNMPSAMTGTLVESTIAFFLLMFTLLWYRTVFEITRDKVKTLKKERDLQ